MIGIRLEISKTAAKSGVTLDNAMETLAPSAAHMLGRSIRERVEERADLAGQPFPGWRQRGKRAYAVSPRYPDRASGRVGPSGAEFFKSRPDYHRENATRPGTYATTGGMWDGLSVVVIGKYRAQIQFRGRSEGANPNFTRAKKAVRTRGIRKGQVMIRPLKINNALKAATILGAHNINVLALDEAEIVRLARLAVDVVGFGISPVLSVEWQSPPQVARWQAERLPAGTSP